VRILLISGLYDPFIQGGAEVVALKLAKGMQKRGHSVCVATTHSEKETKSILDDGIEINRFGIKNSYWYYQYEESNPFKRLFWHVRDIYNCRAAADISFLINKFKPDIAVCHNLAGFSISVWNELSKKGIPVVQILHDYYALCPRSTLFKAGSNCSKTCLTCKVFRLGHGFASQSLTGVIGVSKEVMNIHYKFGMFNTVPLKKVIYNSQNISIEKRKKEESNNLVIGFIGRITPEKGIELLIDSFKELTKKHPNILLKIAGQGEPEYLKILSGKSSEYNIDFLGKIDSTEFYSYVDICVVPSIWQEPLGLVAIEALAHGIPVIGSDLGGIPEIIQHRYNGLIFDPNEPDGLLNSLSEMIQSDELRKSLSGVAASSVLKFIDENRMIDEHVDFYEHAINVTIN
jgi:glycosyltransferase involved in cell wall biosynthesis